jgi:hypothetical protein
MLDHSDVTLRPVVPVGNDAWTYSPPRCHGNCRIVAKVDRIERCAIRPGLSESGGSPAERGDGMDRSPEATSAEEPRVGVPDSPPASGSSEARPHVRLTMTFPRFA